MNNLFKPLCLISSIALVGCSGSSSDGAAAGAADLQGRWGTPCNANTAANTSGRTILTYTGASFTVANTEFGNSIECDGPLFRSANGHYTYALTGEETELGAGNAKNVDVTFVRGSYTGSPDYVDSLVAMGTTLESVLSANEGITVADINNVTPAEFGITNLVEYTIYRVDTKPDGVLELRTGTTSGSPDALTPETRATRLSLTRRFDRLP